MAKFHLTAKQAVAFIRLTDNKHKEIGYGGGAGGGKSILGVFWIIIMCLKYPGTAWLIGRKELTNLKRTTLLSLFQVVDIMGFKNEDLFTLNSQTNIITFPNGSKIFLMDTAHKPSDPLNTRFGSLELTGAFLDESNENNIGVVQIIKTRLGRMKNKEYKIIPKLLETFNPDKNHVHRRYYKPWKEGKLLPHVTFIPALATDNHYLDENYIEQLRNADKITRERLLYGNFDYDDDPTKIFDFDKIQDMFTNNNIIPSRHQLYISCDVARMGSDKTVIIVWKHRTVMRVVTMPKNTVPMVVDAINNLANKYKVPRSNIVIDEDGVGGGVVDYLPGCKGFVNNSTAIETLGSKKIHNYANLKAQCYFKLAEYVNKGEISVYDNIPEEIKELTIEDLEQICQKDPDKDSKVRVETKEEIKEKLGRSPDFSDALMMRMLFEVKSTYKPYVA